MTTAYVMPFNSSPRRFSVFLNGTEYVVSNRWNAMSNSWIMDILSVNGVPILTGVPMVCGADLLSQYEYLGIGGAMIAQTDNAPSQPPAVDNLGSTSQLYYLSEAPQ